MGRFSLILFFVVIVACLSGCASASKNEESGEERVSTLPWNRPASWERSMPGVGASY